MHAQELVAKIQSLPPEKVAVIEDFVEFLRHRDDDRFLTKAAGSDFPPACLGALKTGNPACFAR